MRRLFSLGMLTVMIFASLLVLSPKLAEAKVMWGKTELVKGQIGRVTILQSTNLVKYAGKTIDIVRALKPGQQFRVYSFKNYNGVTLLGVGAGQYVYRNEKITYETPSRAKLEQLAKETGNTQPTTTSNPLDRAGVINSLVNQYGYARLGTTGASFNAFNLKDMSSYDVLVDLWDPSNMIITIKGWQEPDIPYSSRIPTSVKSILQMMIPSGASTIYGIIQETAASDQSGGLNKTYSFDSYKVTVIFTGDAIKVHFVK